MTQILKILEEEHQKMLKTLDTLEAVLQGEDSENSLETVLSQLERQLEEHSKKEEYFLRFFYSATRKGIRGYRGMRDHMDVYASIQLLKDLTNREHAISLDVIEAYGSHLVEILREHITQEDSFVFPMAKETLGPELLESIGRLIEENLKIHSGPQ